jgi:hypothetical protein
VDEAEKELEGMREELGQAQARIETLLEMGDGDGERSEEGSEEASMAFDKVRRPLGRHTFWPIGFTLSSCSRGLRSWSRQMRGHS